ncbi:MAG: signal recognition particle-docking protein FtsY [Eubacteriales bacterium]|nr:signal recognition particle-docking protein FtsY [Eubacteriales bacterium]MDD3350089.1 signal recognition particle-docking protein FtsY [Eubacteriales bacterium]
MFEQKKKSFFGRLQEKIEDVIKMRPEIDEEMMEELEEILIASDIGMDTTFKITTKLREDIKSKNIRDPEGVKARIKEIVCELIDKGEDHKLSEAVPLVILVIGVNGAGKTTSIAKLAHRYRQEGKTVLLAAADTFRAAAAQQLTIWGDRVGVDVIRHQEGADPSAVIFDAVQAAKARGIDVLICDTAGRLQTKKNLMTELEKMYKVIAREFPEAEKEALLVIDAASGKNAVSQAKEFGEVTQLTGIILTKLDGTAKGGIVITVSDMFQIPVKFIGLGEGMSDMEAFDPKLFADALFE